MAWDLLNSLRRSNSPHFPASLLNEAASIMRAVIPQHGEPIVNWDYKLVHCDDGTTRVTDFVVALDWPNTYCKVRGYGKDIEVYNSWVDYDNETHFTDASDAAKAINCILTANKPKPFAHAVTFG